MNGIGCWHGWLAVLLTATAAAATELPSTPGGAAPGRPDRIAVESPPGSDPVQSQIIMSEAPSGDGTGQAAALGTAPCGPWCMNTPAAVFFGSCCPRLGCDPGWSPVSRITCNSPPQTFWYGEVSAVALFRDAEPSGGPIAALDTHGDVVLHAHQAWPDFRAGRPYSLTPRPICFSVRIISFRSGAKRGWLSTWTFSMW